MIFGKGEPKLKLSKNALAVLEKRYLLKNEKGEVIEKPLEMFKRVASFIASAEKNYNQSKEKIQEIERAFLEIMVNLDFLPNSPAFTGAATSLGQMSACFVLPVQDSMEGIFDAVKYSALIHKSGGGTGFSFSRLRPVKSPVRSTKGVASGPVSFMKVFNAATETIKQGGCVVPETRISTEYGIVKINSLAPKNRKVKGWYPHNGRPFAVATDKGIEISDEFYNNGVTMVKKLETSHGYFVVATPEHRFRIIDKNGNYVWRHLQDIKLGDWIALQKDTYIAKGDYSLPTCNFKTHFNSRVIKIPKKATKELGEFIGFFIGDGAMSIDKRGTGRLIFTINDEDKDTKNYLFKITNSLFGISFVSQKKKQDKSTNYFLNSTVLVHWLKQIGVEKDSSFKAYVPEIVFRAGREFVSGFLRGLFSSDGYISQEGYISLSSVSKELIKDVQLILLSLGIPSSQSVTKNRDKAFGKNPLYRLRIITQEGMRIFKENIGFISEKKNKRLVDVKDKAWEFNDIIPNQEERLRKIYNGPGRGCGPCRTKKGANRRLYRDIQHYLPDIFASRNLTRSRLQLLADKYEEIRKAPHLSWFLTNQQFYDKVIQVKEGRSLTLDLAIPLSNTYIANGFVSHNTRRGANMGILRVDHPDIMEFITCKADPYELNNFNISVAVTDKFMKAIEEDKEYDLINPLDGRKVKKLKAKEVFKKICQMAWKNGDPGMIFLDQINRFNPTPQIGEIESTNPCGEQPLLAYESCNLGSINLANFVKEEKIDFEHLKEITPLVVRFLDNVIDLNNYPIEEIQKNTLANRKIGLGVMGWADMLIQLNVPYNSSEALDLAERVLGFLKEEADIASQELAKERGPFPNFSGSVYDKAGAPPIRNATRTTIAPTGTLSIIANSSSGIEPLFAVCYIRKSHIAEKSDEWVELVEVNKYFEEIAKEKGFYSKELMERVAQKGSIQDFEEIPVSVKRLFVTAHDIAPEWHVKIQAAFQKYVDNAVSKTINLPFKATIEDVEKAYLLAYKLGCKGITVYREGSRKIEVLTKGKKAKKEEQPPFISSLIKRERPTVMSGSTYHLKTSYGELYVTVNDDENGSPFEVFATIGKAGGFFAAKSEAICRLISLALRSGIPVEEVVKQIKGIRGPMPSWSEGGMILSLPDAIAQILDRHVSKEQPKLGLKYHNNNLPSTPNKNSPLKIKRSLADIGAVPECPECGNILEVSEGCLKCPACGFSKCD